MNPHSALPRTLLLPLARRRLAEKCRRVEALVERTQGDWEQAFFATLARAMGFGLRGETFARWAGRLDLRAAARHRDDLSQLEALFLGTAGLLAPSEKAGFTERNGTKKIGEVFEMTGEVFENLGREFSFLAHKFSIRPMEAAEWRATRAHPAAAPHRRLAQLAALFHRGLSLSQAAEASGPEALRRLLGAEPSAFWQTHADFATPLARRCPRLPARSADLLIVNAVAPAVEAYARATGRAGGEGCGLALWDALGAERNHVTAALARRGLRARTALESQALMQLEAESCRRGACGGCALAGRCAAGAR